MGISAAASVGAPPIQGPWPFRQNRNKRTLMSPVPTFKGEHDVTTAEGGRRRSRRHGGGSSTVDDNNSLFSNASGRVGRRGAVTPRPPQSRAATEQLVHPAAILTAYPKGVPTSITREELAWQNEPHPTLNIGRFSTLKPFAKPPRIPGVRFPPV
jgi:hypothetical protein